MKEKRNDLWKLDFLEAKYTQTTPRFSFTKKLINARNNSHIMRKLPSTPNEAFQQIHALKSDLFRKKFHGSYKKLSRDVSRTVKLRQNQRLGGEQEKHIEQFLHNASFLEELITAKLVKITQAAILTTKEAKQNPPAFISEDVRDWLSDKALARNPSRFFITYCQKDKVLNDYISKLWNMREMKTLCLEIEWTLRKIRGNLTKAEIAARTHETGASAKDIVADKDRIGPDLSDGDESESGSENEEQAEIDQEEACEKFTTYDDLVAGSDEEQEFMADHDVDHAEITDVGMSGSEDVNSAKKVKAKTTAKTKEETKEETSATAKNSLPQLATGYYSGGSEDEDGDVDSDKVVREAMTMRKNRRGQRARQKIWEQKYGKKAVHVQKEHLRIASEREQKQQEFEERQRKRELKAKMAQRANLPKTAGLVVPVALGGPLKVHPSWEAKKLTEEKMKNVKFEGKKIMFD